MTQVNLYEAKTQLSRLVDRAAAGEDIVIAKNGTPVAVLVAPSRASPKVREFGFLKEQMPHITEEQWAESDEYVRQLFEDSINEEI
jgi:prevent-host-death family protein